MSLACVSLTGRFTFKQLGSKHGKNLFPYLQSYWHSGIVHRAWITLNTTRASLTSFIWILTLFWVPFCQQLLTWCRKSSRSLSFFPPSMLKNRTSTHWVSSWACSLLANAGCLGWPGVCQVRQEGGFPLSWRNQDPWCSFVHVVECPVIGGKNILLSGYARKSAKTFCQILTYQNEWFNSIDISN